MSTSASDSGAGLPAFLTITATARRLRTGRVNIWRYIQVGVVPAVRVGVFWLIPESYVRQFDDDDALPT